MNSDIVTQIKTLKIKLGELWDERGKTDQEILNLSVEIDRLINQYYRIEYNIRGKFAMKKYLILLLAIIMMGAFTVTTSAGSLGVNVPPGYILEVDSQFTLLGNDFCPSLVAGLNDKLALGVMYDTSFNYFTVSGRYSPVKNLAANVYYRFYGLGSWKADLRGKTFINQNLALSGMASYETSGSGSFGALGQAEYLVNENWMGNAGLNYTNSTTFLLLGADFASGNLAVGFNCIFRAADFSNSMIEVVVDYFIKK